MANRCNQVVCNALVKPRPSLRDGLSLDSAHALSVACLNYMAIRAVVIATGKQADTRCQTYAFAEQGCAQEAQTATSNDQVDEPNAGIAPPPTSADRLLKTKALQNQYSMKV